MDVPSDHKKLKNKQMKKYVFVFCLVIIQITTLQASSKKLFGWFHITPKIGFGGSMITSSSMFDYDDAYPRIYNPSFNFGGQIGIAFMDQLDVSFEVNQDILNQEYEIKLNDLMYNKNIKLTNLDYGLIFKYMGSTGSFELGGMISNTKDIDVGNEVLLNERSSEPQFLDNTDYFNKKYYSLVAGLCGSLYQDGLFEISLGLRFKYRLQPFTGPELPLEDNVYPSNFSNNSKNRNMSFTLDLQIHNFFGFFGRSICGGQRVMFFQRPKKLW